MSEIEKSKSTKGEIINAKVKEEICPDSRIDAPRVFSEKEILSAIQGTLRTKPALAREALTETGLLAKIRMFLRGIFSEKAPKQEKGAPTPLRISKIIKDKSGNVVSLDAVAPNAGGMGKDIKIFYLLQGKHGRDSSAGTTVMHAGYDISGKRISGEVVSEFKGGKWVQIPK